MAETEEMTAEEVAGYFKKAFRRFGFAHQHAGLPYPAGDRPHVSPSLVLGLAHEHAVRGEVRRNVPRRRGR